MKRTTNKLKWLTKITVHTFMCWCLSLMLPGGIVPVKAEEGTTVGLPSISAQHQQYMDSINKTRAEQGLPPINSNDTNSSTNPNGSTLTGAATATSAAETSGGSGGLAKAGEDGAGGGETVVNGNVINATGKFLFANMGLVAIGLGAPSLVKECWNKWSVRVFAASAGIYVLNEIGLFTRFNSAINKEMKAYLGRGDEDRQIDSLESAAKQTRKAKEAAKRRAMIAKVASVGFLAAGALAIMENMSRFGMDEGCQSMGGGATDGAGGFITPPVSDTYYVYAPTNDFTLMGLLENEQELSLEITSYLNQPTVREHYRYYRFSENSLMAKFTGAVMPAAYAQEAVGTDKDAKVVKNKDGKNEIIVNSVGAKVIAMGLGAAGGMALMNTNATFLEPIKENIIKNPLGRAVGFGVFGATALGAAKESEDAANKLEQRAKEYDRLADSLRNRVDQSIDTGTGATSQFIDQTVQQTGNQTGGGLSNNSVCATGGTSTGLKLDSNCSCATTKTCASPQIPDTKGLPSFAGTALLSDTIGSLGKTTSDMMAGRLDAARTNGQAMTNNAARITKLRNALKKKFNEDRLTDGKKPIDFEKAEAGFANGMERQLENAFNNLSPREQAALARLGSGFGTGLNSGEGDDEKKEDELADRDSKEVSKVAAVDVNPNAGKGSNKSNDGAVWDFNFEDDAAAAKAEQDAIAAALAEQEDENYVVDGDINDDRNKNLFNIITRRYLKSAYPVIFEEQ